MILEKFSWSDLVSDLPPSNHVCFSSRVHELEEQMKDAETKAAESLEEETKRHREAYTKLDRDRNTEIDLLCNRYIYSADDSVHHFVGGIENKAFSLSKMFFYFNSIPKVFSMLLPALQSPVQRNMFLGLFLVPSS